MTITSASISSVFAYPTPPGQQTGPEPYGFAVGVPPAYVAGVTALITHAYNSGDALGISVADRLVEAPQVATQFSGQRLSIAVLGRKAARQLYRLLVPAG